MTLVELIQPFDQIRDWLAKRLEHCSPCPDVGKFYGRFSRYRAVLASEPVFRLGIDLLTQSLKMTCDYFKVPCFVDDFACMVEEMFVSPVAYPDAHMFLTETMKNYRVGLLTNADNYILNRAIAKQGFTFDFVITSEDAKCNKPHPEIFEYAVRALAVNKQDVVMVGDSQVDDVSGAGQLGIKAIWINRQREKLKEGITSPVYEATNLADSFVHLPMVWGENMMA